MTEDKLIKLLQLLASGLACSLLMNGCSTAHIVSADYSAEFRGRYAISDTSGDDAMMGKTIDLAFDDGGNATVTIEESHRVLHLDTCKSLAGSYANLLANADSNSILHGVECLDEDDESWSFVHAAPGAKTSAGYTLFRYVTSRSGYVVRRSKRGRYSSDLALEPITQ
ncbi:hypothetical protein G3N59_00440 [Paraburkholderia sp. Ac-20340]|uniref:hypothetical protein n=1 Tax=Paraburkholderia sp. Ac-20340 TaxID=2703888 RepID=UPI00197D3AE2|nr:hypothetical protein [Paraburkholderia sp. Ac-20340]MBN3851832.1 hypothetical protein [Paraburkholderia sp. Ac-20340]